MANTATARSAVPVALKEGFGYAKVTPVVCTFDTLATDLTIFTPTVSTNYAAIVGLVYQEASAHSLTITAGSTVLVTLEVPASGGRQDCRGIGKAGHSGGSERRPCEIKLVRWPSYRWRTRRSVEDSVRHCRSEYDACVLRGIQKPSFELVMYAANSKPDSKASVLRD